MNKFPIEKNQIFFWIVIIAQNIFNLMIYRWGNSNIEQTKVYYYSFLTTITLFWSVLSVIFAFYVTYYFGYKTKFGRIWFILFLAILFNFAGDLSLALKNMSTTQSTIIISLSDFFWVISYILFSIGFVKQIQSFGKKTSHRNIWIIIVIELILIVVLTITLFIPMYNQLNNSGFGVFNFIIMMIYPLADLIFVIPVLMIILNYQKEPISKAWILISIGVIFAFTANLGFFYLATKQSYVVWNYFDLIYINFYIFVVAGAIKILVLFDTSNISNIESTVQLEQTLLQHLILSLNTLMPLDKFLMEKNAKIMNGMVVFDPPLTPEKTQLEIKRLKMMGTLLIGSHFYEDILNRMNLEKTAIVSRLEEKEREIAIIYQNAPIGICTLDIDGKIKNPNKKFCELIGYNQKELENFKLWELILENLEGFDQQTITRFLTSHSIQHLEHETRLKRKNWEIKEVMIRFTHLNQEQNQKNKQYAIAIIEDLSEKRKLEKELELKQMDEETIRIQRLESLGYLANGITHDLNNIIQNFVVNISMMRDLTNNPEIQHKIIECDAVAQQAQNLSKQLFYFTKGEPFAKKTIDILEFIQDNAEMVLKHSRNRLKIGGESSILRIQGDPTQLSQVFQKIIINADQAMEKPGTITIRILDKEIFSNSGFPLNPGRYLLIEIEDEGKGILEEHNSKIFTPYFTTKPNGLGLGLAISYVIVRNHGGIITFKSQVNKGTVFSIYLPI